MKYHKGHKILYSVSVFELMSLTSICKKHKEKHIKCGLIVLQDYKKVSSADLKLPNQLCAKTDSF